MTYEEFKKAFYSAYGEESSLYEQLVNIEECLKPGRSSSSYDSWASCFETMHRIFSSKGFINPLDYPEAPPELKKSLEYLQEFLGSHESLFMFWEGVLRALPQPVLSDYVAGQLTNIAYRNSLRNKY